MCLRKPPLKAFKARAAEITTAEWEQGRVSPSVYCLYLAALLPWIQCLCNLHSAPSTESQIKTSEHISSCRTSCITLLVESSLLLFLQNLLYNTVHNCLKPVRLFVTV